MVVRSSPKDLGLSVGTLDCLRTVHGLDFWAVSNSTKTEIPRLFSDSTETEIPRLFSDSPELEYETEYSRTVHAYSLVCIAEMNNMCSCENYFVNASSVGVLTWIV